MMLVEQNANYALGVSERGYVLETGTIALTDTSSTCARKRVQAAYLGRDVTLATLILAAIGIKAFYLLSSGWLGVGARELSERKGYGKKWGLATGILSLPRQCHLASCPARRRRPGRRARRARKRPPLSSKTARSDPGTPSRPT